MTKHLYIHITFCKNICKYCDFARILYDYETASKYIDLVIEDIKKRFKHKQFTTIYIGGGTPNALDDDLLLKLLTTLDSYAAKKVEFSIEVKPNLLTEKQIEIFKKTKVNRFSIGVQTLEEQILKEMNCSFAKEDIQKAIDLFHANGYNNLSCDLIYGFNNHDATALSKNLNFMRNNNIRHLSCYSLEIKDGSILTKHNYKVDEQEIDDQLAFIENYLQDLGYTRYEVSNWTADVKDVSYHNIAYWQSSAWAAVGYGAHGFENRTIYKYLGSILDWKIEKKKLTINEYYFQIIMMGLRTTFGLDLGKSRNMKAYTHFKKALDANNLVRIENNYLRCTNINLLNNVLLDLV